MKTGNRQWGRVFTWGVAWACAVCPCAANEAERSLSIAFEEYPPYEYMENGSPTGINVEVISGVLNSLGVRHEYKIYPFSREWMLLKRGAVDIAPSISYQDDREPYLHYTAEQKAFRTTGVFPRDYLWITEYVFFVDRRYKDALRFESYEQIKKDRCRIGVIKNYSYEPDFWRLPQRLRTFFYTQDAFKAVAEGEIDMFPFDRQVGVWTLKALGLSEQITYLPKPLFAKPYLLVASKASTYPGLEDLMREFYAALRRMRDDGTYRSIVARYVPSQFGDTAHRKLRVVCEQWEPFEYHDGERPRGINVEVTDRIMRRLNVPYEIRIYPWSRAWMMIEKGDAEAVLSVSYNENREQSLFYTPEQRAFAKTGAMPPDYLWISEYVFFVMKKRAHRLKFESYEQIRKDGCRVGTNRDYSYHPSFLEAKLGCRVYSGTEEGLRGLVRGEIDLYPMDRIVGTATLAAMGLAESVTFLPNPMFRKPYLASFSRCSDFPALEQVMYAFYAELRRMRESGEYDAIAGPYLDAESAVADE